MTPLTTWFDNYSADHRNATNQLIHVWCVPAIMWSVVALLWCIPVAPNLGRPGFWSGMAIAAASIFYWQLSRRLEFGMLIVFVASWLSCLYLQTIFGVPFLFWTATTVFVVAWIGQFIGHKIEGRKPSFLTDLSYLLIGPLWVLAKVYRRLGIPY